VEALKAKIKVCMFDQYGTVVDVQNGLTEVVTPYLREKEWSGRSDEFVTWWRRTHFENSMIDALLHKEHTPYREIMHRAVAYTLQRAGIPYTTDEVRFLVAQIERLKPFPDVPDALARGDAAVAVLGKHQSPWQIVDETVRSLLQPVKERLACVAAGFQKQRLAFAMLPFVNGVFGNVGK
jgi:phosphoglycolate phosphatase-like HAD superfamily hydrolase